MLRLRRSVGLGAALAGLSLLVVLIPSATAAGPRLLGLLNVPPIGSNDAYTTPFATRLDVDTPGVLANDIDLDHDQLEAVLVNGTSHGVLRLDKDGKVRYEPGAGFSGVDTFTYRPFDGTVQAILPAIVTITVKAKPVATPSPTPRPTTSPTASPASTPSPTPKPTPTPTPTLPLPTLPLPTLALPSSPGATPIPTDAPGPSSAAAPGDETPRPSEGPGLSPDPSPTRDAAVIAAGGTVASGGGGPTGGGPDEAPTILTPALSADGSFSFASFGDAGVGIEWIVPSVLVTVPGFLLIVVGLAQVFGGFMWLPVARRSMRGDGRRPARGLRERR